MSVVIENDFETASRKTTAMEKGIVFIVMAFIAVLMTWPLVLELKTAINDYGDPLLNAWILWWDVKALFTPGLELFNAPIFHPHLMTLAYSEHLVATALTMAPYLLLGGDAMIAYNLAFLLSFALSGFGGYLLGYELTGKKQGAWVVGLGYGFACFRFGQLGHLQILTAHFMPFVMLYLHRWIKKPAWSFAVLFGFFWCLQNLSCGYHALFISFSVGLFLVFYGLKDRLWKDKKRLVQLGVVCVLLLAVVGPLFYPYIKVQKQMGFVRTLDQAQGYSAELEHYLASPQKNLLFGELTKPFRRYEGELFLGLTLTALVVAGLFISNYKQRTSIVKGFDQFFYLSLALLAAWASLGPKYGLYTLLYQVLPGFDAIRVPSRIAVIVTLAWASLAGMGMAKITDRLSGTGILKFVLPFLACGLILLESFGAPYHFEHIYKDTPLVYKWLAKRPQEMVLMEIPTRGYGGDMARDARYLFWSTKHGKTLINGYSGFFPADFQELTKKVYMLPSPEVLDDLRKMGAQYIVLHIKEFPRHEHQGILKQYKNSPYLKKIYSDTWDYVYRILPKTANTQGS